LPPVEIEAASSAAMGGHETATTSRAAVAAVGQFRGIAITLMNVGTQ
jgi:hypothetical protein